MDNLHLLEVPDVFYYLYLWKQILVAKKPLGQYKSEWIKSLFLSKACNFPLQILFLILKRVSFDLRFYSCEVAYDLHWRYEDQYRMYQENIS